MPKRTRFPTSVLSNTPSFLALITIFFWSFGSLLGRLVAIRSAFVILCFSFFFSFITLLLYLIFSKNFSFTWYRKVRPIYFLIGPLGYFVYSIAITQSSRSFDSISETTILNNTWPIFTVIFSELMFRRNKKSLAIRFLEGVGIFLGIMSVIILVTAGDLRTIHLDPSGILWGLIAGMSYGVFGAYSGTINSEDQKIFLFVSVSVSLLFISIPAAFEIRTISPIILTDVLIAFALGALLDGVGYILWTRAIRITNELNARISTIASLMFFLPFINLAMVGLILKENQLSQSYFVGSLFLILIATYIIQKAVDISDFVRSRIRIDLKPKP